MLSRFITKTSAVMSRAISNTIIRKYYITCDFYVTIFGEGSRRISVEELPTSNSFALGI
jgi:hypothetical protein